MKKFLCFMLMMISMVLSSTLITCCNGHHRENRSYFDYTDSIEIAKIAEAVVNENVCKNYSNPEEFLASIAKNKDVHNAETIVYGLNNNILSGIVYSLSSQKVPISIVNIANEYKDKQAFYNGFAKTMAIDNPDSVPREQVECTEDSTKGGNNG